MRCTNEWDENVGEYTGVVCKVYLDDEEVSEVRVRLGDDEFEFEATNPKYLGLVLNELKKSGIIG